MALAFAEIAFTPAVRDVQRRQGSADSYAKFLTQDAVGGDALGNAEQEFISARDGFYQASVSETGWPYVQFRGGPTGFLKILSPTTIAYADFRGNRQYISAGNLAGNDRVSLILMDYPNRKRLKIWGRVKLTDRSDDPDLVSSLKIENYRGLAERAAIITVEAFDWNCPQHIPQRLTMEEMKPHLAGLHDQIAQLEAENTALKSRLEPSE